MFLPYSTEPQTSVLLLERRATMYELLAHRHIRYFCLTVILLAFISGALRTAVPLLATQSGYAISGVSWAQGLFSLAWPVFGIIAGTILDRNDKISLAVMASIIFAALHVALVILFLMHLAPPEHVFAYAVIAGVVVVSAEAYIMTIPPIIMDGARLRAFYSIVLFLDFGFAYFIGPVAASFVLAYGRVAFFLLIILAFGVTIFSIRRAIPALPAVVKPAITISYILAGFRFILSSRHLASLTALTFFLSVAFGAFLTSFIFFVTDQEYLGLDKSRYGLMFAAYALGAMIGSIIVRRFSGLTSVRVAIIADVLGTAALLIVPALTNNVVTVWLTTFLAGVGLSLWFISVTTFRQQLTPQELLGRANSAFRVIGYAGMPVGSFLIGMLATITSLSLAAIAIGSLLVISLVVTFPFLWGVDKAPIPASANI